ncbi:MAG: hypothetical protein MO846_04495 [Candidatus Devosia symbiotica]|nr:hypothetical protein [Candidatus Devosia symbiotica]
MAILVGINIDKQQPIPAKSGMTGIYKQPVAGDVMVTAEDIEDDAILDRRHHGGKDQAVYLYFKDNYDWWADQLDADICPRCVRRKPDHWRRRGLHGGYWRPLRH